MDADYLVYLRKHVVLVASRVQHDSFYPARKQAVQAAARDLFIPVERNGLLRNRALFRHAAGTCTDDGQKNKCKCRYSHSVVFKRG